MTQEQIKTVDKLWKRHSHLYDEVGYVISEKTFWKAFEEYFESFPLDKPVKPANGGYIDKEIRERASTRFNNMQKRFREIGAEACAIDCVRDLVMMRDRINELIETRIGQHKKFIKESDSRLSV